MKRKTQRAGDEEDDFAVGPLLVDLAEGAHDRADTDEHPPELHPWAPPIRALALDALTLVKQAVPGASERWVAGWGVYLIKTPAPGPRMFAYVAPLVDRVRLGLQHGALVPDPHELFEPTASRLHHRELRHARDLAHKGLPAVLKAAATLVPPRNTRRKT